jgi:hypothetical protein
MEVSGQLYDPGNLPRYPLDRRLVGPQTRSGRYGEETNLAPAGNRNPVVQPVASPAPVIN